MPEGKEHRPSESEIAQADDYLRAGCEWDEICHLVNPHYLGWDESEQEVYRIRLRYALQSRRAERGETADDN
jgi:hypothetical protein